MSEHPAPPTSRAPATARLHGAEIDLVGPAREICRRYRLEYPDEQGRYGEAGIAWCVHDNQHILSWAVMAVEYELGMERQLEWLAGVLGSRDFPLERLARDLEIAAEVVEDAAVAERLRGGAAFVSASSGQLGGAARAHRVRAPGGDLALGEQVEVGDAAPHLALRHYGSSGLIAISATSSSAGRRRCGCVARCRARRPRPRR